MPKSQPNSLLILRSGLVVNLVYKGIGSELVAMDILGDAQLAGDDTGAPFPYRSY
jgi:hypothetical protein